MKASRPTPISCHTGPTLCSTCSIENVSCPAGTGVWVVNVLAARTLPTASANGVPRVTSSRTRSTSMNAACPSFACQAAGSYPRARNPRTPPTPRTHSCRSRSSLPPANEPQPLLGVSLGIGQAAAHERDAQLRSRLALVPGEGPEASGIDWHRGVQPELGTEVRDRPLDELGIRGGEPGAGGRRVLRHRSRDDVVKPQELRVRRAGGEPLRRHASQQLDGIVLRAAPQRRVE